MEEPGKLDVLDDRFKAYLSTSIQLVKLEAIERSSVLVASLFSRLIILVPALIALIFLSIGASFFLAQYVGRYDLGFGIVAGFYVLVTLFLILGRRNITEKPLRNAILNKMMSDT
ncbi:MAG TPA: hypothetical protein DIW47_05370 [Bacteroidetes bacterium]|nr:hypothetical protein [Bacteroidota bacterium]